LTAARQFRFVCIDEAQNRVLRLVCLVRADNFDWRRIKNLLDRFALSFYILPNPALPMEAGKRPNGFTNRFVRGAAQFDAFVG